MKALFALIAASLLNGCGSLTPALESGQGFYSELPKSEVIGIVAANKSRASKLETGATGCFAIAPESVDKKIIEPAVKKIMAESQAFAAENVKASRQMAPTLIDAITGAFIWGCSYWNVTGDLLQVNDQANKNTTLRINTLSDSTR